MCFCSFQLCNASNQLNCPSFWTLTLLVFLATAYTATTATTVTTQTFYWIIWDPWPKSWHPYATKLPAANVKKKPSPIHSSDLFLRILFSMYMKVPSLIIQKNWRKKSKVKCFFTLENFWFFFGNLQLQHYKKLIKHYNILNITRRFKPCLLSSYGSDNIQMYDSRVSTFWPSRLLSANYEIMKIV